MFTEIIHHIPGMNPGPAVATGQTPQKSV